MGHSHTRTPQDPQIPPVTLQSQPAPAPERSDSAPKGKCHQACSESTEKLWFVPRIKPPTVTRASLFVPPSLSRQFLEIKMSFHQAKSKHISVPEYVCFFISSFFFFFPFQLSRLCHGCPGLARNGGNSETPTPGTPSPAWEPAQHDPSGAQPSSAPSSPWLPAFPCQSSNFHILCLYRESPLPVPWGRFSEEGEHR